MNTIQNRLISELKKIALNQDLVEDFDRIEVYHIQPMQHNNELKAVIKND